MTGDKLLRTVFLLIWAIALVNAAAEYYYLYWIYRWFDMPMHFLGGLWLGLAGLWVYYYSGYLGARVPDGRAVYVALLTGLTMGVAWEAYEFAVWELSGKGLPLNYYADTMLDLVMDVAGACSAYAMYYVSSMRQPLTSSLIE